jgi:hypothetical protein
MNSSASARLAAASISAVAGVGAAEGDVVATLSLRRSRDVLRHDRDAGAQRRDRPRMSTPSTAPARLSGRRSAGSARNPCSCRRPTGRRWRPFSPGFTLKVRPCRRRDRDAPDRRRRRRRNSTPFRRRRQGADWPGRRWRLSARIRSAARRRPRLAESSPQTSDNAPSAPAAKTANRAGTGRACRPTWRAGQHVARAEPQHATTEEGDGEDGEEGQDGARAPVEARAA